MMLVVADMSARMLGGVVPGLQPAEEKATGLLRVLPEEVVVLVTEVSPAADGSEGSSAASCPYWCISPKHHSFAKS